MAVVGVDPEGGENSGLIGRGWGWVMDGLKGEVIFKVKYNLNKNKELAHEI